MENTLKLPCNYQEIEEEMVYLDGGWSWTMLGKNLLGIYNWANSSISKGVGYTLRQIGFWGAARNLAYQWAPVTANYVAGVIASAINVLKNFGWYVAGAALVVLGAGTAFLANYRVFY